MTGANKSKKAVPKPAKAGRPQSKIASPKASHQHGPQTGSNSQKAKTSIVKPVSDPSTNGSSSPDRVMDNIVKAPNFYANSTSVPRVGGVPDPTTLRIEELNTWYDLREVNIKSVEEGNQASGYNNDFESPGDMFEEAPQLQAWVYETSSSELTVGEWLQKHCWEKEQYSHKLR